MANDYNTFGAVIADVIELYPATAEADYGPSGAIQAAMDRAVRRLVNYLPKRVHDTLTYRVTQEILAGPAFEGQGPTFTLGLGPIATADATNIKIYREQGNEDGSKPAVCPAFNADNQTGTLGGTGNQTLTLTGTNTTLSENEYLMITYIIDPTDATFTMPSFADYVIYSSAFELGAKLFDQETDTWKLVEDYQAFAGDPDAEANEPFGLLKALMDGEFISDALRQMEFCENVEPAGSQIQSVRKARG